jgi:Lon protease-like protein
MLPLHVFEPRYVRLVEDLLDQGNNQLALALLIPSWDTEYFEKPEIFPVAGVGSMVSCQRMPENRFNILIEGKSRARLEELPQEIPYRQTRFTLLNEQPVTDPAKQKQLRIELTEGFCSLTDEIVLPDPKRPLGYLADVLLIAAGVSLAEKQRIFSILDVEARVHEVLNLVDQAKLQSSRCNSARGRSPQNPLWN